MVVLRCWSLACNLQCRHPAGTSTVHLCFDDVNSGKRKDILCQSLSNMSSSITHSSMRSRDANILTACSTPGVYAHIAYRLHSALYQLLYSRRLSKVSYDIHRPMVSALTIPSIFLAIPSRCICTRWTASPRRTIVC